MNKFKIVLKNVFFQNVKSPVFILTLLLPIIVGGFAMFAGQSTASSAKVAVVSPSRELTSSFTKLEADHIEYVVGNSKNEAREDLIKGKLDGYLVLQTKNGELSASLYDTNQSRAIKTAEIELAVNQIGLAIKANYLNLPPKTLKKIVQPTDFKTHTSTVSNKKLVTRDQSKMLFKVTAVMIITMLLFLLLITYMGQMASNIGREKGERVMEIILSSTDAKSQFLGEVLGLFLTFLLQIVIYLILGFGVMMYYKDRPTYSSFFKNLDLSLIFSPEMLYALIFGLLGVFTYLVIAATLGALVSNIEQVNQAIIPLMIPVFLAYVLVIMGISGVGIAVARVFAFIPLVSQTLMPFLLVLGKCSWVEALVSLGISTIFLIIISFISIKVYPSNVLVYSEKGFLDSLKTSILFHKKATIKK